MKLNKDDEGPEHIDDILKELFGNNFSEIVLKPVSDPSTHVDFKQNYIDTVVSHLCRLHSMSEGGQEVYTLIDKLNDKDSSAVVGIYFCILKLLSEDLSLLGKMIHYMRMAPDKEKLIVNYLALPDLIEDMRMLHSINPKARIRIVTQIEVEKKGTV